MIRGIPSRAKESAKKVFLIFSVYGKSVFASSILTRLNDIWIDGIKRNALPVISHVSCVVISKHTYYYIPFFKMGFTGVLQRMPACLGNIPVHVICICAFRNKRSMITQFVFWRNQFQHCTGSISFLVGSIIP